MNLPVESVQNLLFVPPAEEYALPLHRFWLKCASAGATVLLFTHKQSQPKFVPLLQEFEMDYKTANETMSRAIIMLCADIDDVTCKLLELHDWVVKPTIVVIDLCAFVARHLPHSTEAMNETLAPEPLLYSICHCIASLLNYMACAGGSEQQPVATSTTQAAGTRQECRLCSVVVLQSCGEILTQQQLELLINLYYFKNSALDDLEELKKRILVAAK